ncbi:hypothetical protein BT63DRAFT_419918 [Microthyrium microscopicum]|uniref:Uncharacterized protein n=1 Tax=Microthyrium microscopicum TaxID=703497 RepID=A0A6A6US93_9PEZI|nr:hypothetical protein BT63DRAFT_419918 [Microthyrium microscopicum]
MADNNDGAGNTAPGPGKVLYAPAEIWEKIHGYAREEIVEHPRHDWNTPYVRRSDESKGLSRKRPFGKDDPATHGVLKTLRHNSDILGIGKQAQKITRREILKRVKIMLERNNIHALGKLLHSEGSEVRCERPARRLVRELDISTDYLNGFYWQNLNSVEPNRDIIHVRNPRLRAVLQRYQRLSLANQSELREDGIITDGLHEALTIADSNWRGSDGDGSDEDESDENKPKDDKPKDNESEDKALKIAIKSARRIARRRKNGFKLDTIIITHYDRTGREYINEEIESTKPSKRARRLHRRWGRTMGFYPILNTIGAREFATDKAEHESDSESEDDFVNIGTETRLAQSQSTRLRGIAALKKGKFEPLNQDLLSPKKQPFYLRVHSDNSTLHRTINAFLRKPPFRQDDRLPGSIYPDFKKVWVRKVLVESSLFMGQDLSQDPNHVFAYVPRPFSMSEFRLVLPYVNYTSLSPAGVDSHGNTIQSEVVNNNVSFWNTVEKFSICIQDRGAHVDEDTVCDTGPTDFAERFNSLRNLRHLELCLPNFSLIKPSWCGTGVTGHGLNHMLHWQQFQHLHTIHLENISFGSMLNGSQWTLPQIRASIPLPGAVLPFMGPPLVSWLPMTLRRLTLKHCMTTSLAEWVYLLWVLLVQPGRSLGRLEIVHPLVNHFDTTYAPYDSRYHQMRAVCFGTDCFTRSLSEESSEVSDEGSCHASPATKKRRRYAGFDPDDSGSPSNTPLGSPPNPHRYRDRCLNQYFWQENFPPKDFAADCGLGDSDDEYDQLPTDTTHRQRYEEKHIDEELDPATAQGIGHNTRREYWYARQHYPPLENITTGALAGLPGQLSWGSVQHIQRLKNILLEMHEVPWDGQFKFEFKKDEW